METEMTSKEKAALMEKYQRERLEYWKRRNPPPPPAVPAESPEAPADEEEIKNPAKQRKR